MARMVIDDVLWEKIKGLLPKPKGRHGQNDRLFIEAICWMLRAGAAWRNLPPEYGNWKTVYDRYNDPPPKKWTLQERSKILFICMRC